MTETADKDRVIRQVYYDIDTGFDSVINTYRKANKISSSITLADVKAFLDKQKSRQNKPYRGFNSYVSPKALHEFQIDIGVGHRAQKITMDLGICFWRPMHSANIFIAYQ